jgi:hypothetical protein
MLGVMLISVTATAQNGWEDERLKGLVIMVKQRCHKVLLTPEGPQKGNVANCIVGNEDHVFDQRGRCAEVSSYSADNKLEWKASYDYKSDDKAEMVLTSVSGSVQSKTVYHYNSAGKITEEQLYNVQGDLLEKLEHRYDANNANKISTSCYKPKGGLSWKENYEYDKLGNKISYKHYDATGKLGWQTVYKYDRFGVKIEEGSYDASGNELSLSAYEYVYDYYNNWIQQIIFTYDLNKNKIPENIIERDITYY